ncbi:transporter [Klebsiella michiganensis]|uniref:Transporter n=1 Tax=Klebsiella michiganensis TaxID=1134687 RepID=A0A7H4PIE3_9ENTR|nr:transporter [Klebsiella michiganensis]
MEMSFIASFWLVSFLLIITPGADWAYTISAGINGRRVIPAVAGLMSGHLLATLIVIAGIGVLIANHPLALSTLTLLGAGYLMWLGIAILRHPPTPGAQQHSAGSWNRWAIKGLCISGLNPKVFLLFSGPPAAVYRPPGKLVGHAANADTQQFTSVNLHTGLPGRWILFTRYFNNPPSMWRI